MVTKNPARTIHDEPAALPGSARRRRGGRRRRAVACLVLASALTLGACGAAGDEDPTTTSTDGQDEVTIGLTYVPNVQFAPWYVAQDAGYFADEGAKVALRHHGQDEDLFGALRRGVEQVVVAGGDEMLQARSTGADVVGFATVYQQYPVRIIVPGDSDITTLADLRGERIGTPGRYGQTWFGLLALLDQGGLSEQDVTVSEIGFTQQTALSTGHVDAVVGFVNNDIPQFLATGMKVRSLDQGALPLVGIGMGASAEVVADDAGELAGILAAVRRATADIVADPQVAITSARRHIPGTLTEEQEGVMLAAIKATIPLYGTIDDAWGRPSPRAWAAMAEFMSDADLLEGPVDVDEAMTDTIAANQ